MNEKFYQLPCGRREKIINILLIRCFQEMNIRELLTVGDSRCGRNFKVAFILLL